MDNSIDKTPPAPEPKPHTRRVRPESEKDTGQAPPEDIGGGAPTEDVDFGADVDPGERQRREDELARTGEGF